MEAIGIIVALATFAFSLFYNRWRDRKSKLKDIRVQFLLDTYRRLTNSANRNPKEAHAYWSKMEGAIADIQLLGTEEQIRIANKFVDEIISKNTTNVAELINLLRDELRSELGMPKLTGNIRYLRFHNTKDIEKG